MLKGILIFLVEMKKLIYIHIPKCAGNSMHSIKSDKLKIWSHNIRKPNFRPYPRSRLQFAISKFPLIFSNYYHSFTIVRNTWSRVYSAYSYLSVGGRSEEDYQDYLTFIEPYSDFNDFVMNGLKEAKAKQLHFMTQLFWIQNQAGEVVVDEIISFENMEPKLKQLFSKSNISLDKFPHKNISSNEKYQNKYNSKSIKIVKESYKDEIKYFNFQF